VPGERLGLAPALIPSIFMAFVEGSLRLFAKELLLAFFNKPKGPGGFMGLAAPGIGLSDLPSDSANDLRLS
jgi:hypothetical protein